MDELFSFFTNTINTDLQPQTSDDIGIGVRHYFTPVLFGSVNLFRIDTKNEIFYNPEIFINTNLDAKSRRDGLGLTLTRQFDRLSITGNYTYLDTEILDGRFSGNEIPGVPNHKAGLEARINLEYGFSLGINGTYVGRRYFESDFGNEFDRQDEFVVCNARLDYAWKKLSAYLIVNNIFNEEYSEYGVLGGFPVERAYYPSPKTNFLVGVSFVY
jgi:iron complex outermembrane receptor protein